MKLFNQLSPKYKEAKLFNADQVEIEKEQYSTLTFHRFPRERPFLSITIDLGHIVSKSCTIQKRKS